MILNFLRTIERDSDFAACRMHLESFPPQSARFRALDPPLPEVFRKGLADLDIRELFSHQAEAIDKIRDGKNVVVVTPTASGKTLSYFLPVAEELVREPESSALVLFPLKALEQDQKLKAAHWQKVLKNHLDLSVEIYDGDTPGPLRARLKKKPPQLLFSNPDMLHAGFMAFHQGWEKFLKRLRFVVIDELHAYRGIFGSHILQVFRRLSRLLEYYGVQPQFIALSATIANPLELAEKLTGRPFELVSESGAPMGTRHFLFLDPPQSVTGAAARLFVEGIEHGLKTIVFTRARVTTEIIYRTILDTRPDLAKFVSSYRAGFLPEERREIESRLASGELKGVVSTSALELGIDIGGLDLCILAGYPGSVNATWQRAGRVGRRGEESGVILLTQPDALDQYFLHNPSDFFGRSCEAAIVNEDNEEILRAHLPSAAAEIPLMEGDPYIDTERVRPVIQTLEREGLLVRSASGKQWFPGVPRPQQGVSIRHVGKTFDIVDPAETKPIGEISGAAVFRECHDGAIYLHRGRQYEVQKLDLEKKRVEVLPISAAIYTMVRSDKQTEILGETARKKVLSIVVHSGIVKVTETYHSYERRRLYSQELLSVEPLELPPQSYTTQSVWIEIPPEVPARLAAEERHFMGGIHAIEHAAISLIPLFALCDRSDVGGISYTMHPQVGSGAVFIYDGYPGGAGIAKRVYEVILELLERTRKLISECPCEEGCPSCIHSPRCGAGNKPLDKTAAVMVLDGLLTTPGEERLEAAAIKKVSRREKPEAFIPGRIPSDRRILVFDLETQHSAEEVGGWSAIRQMRLALGGVYDSRDEKISFYDEAHVSDLIAHLREGDLVVGYNQLRFDYEVLRGYTFDRFDDLPSLDMLVEVERQAGLRLKLDTLARATLGVKKLADGLQSIAWWKEGRLDLIEEYCRKDIEITRDLFLFAVGKGYLVYERKDFGAVRIPLRWNLEEIMRSGQVGVT
jgi:DEAD/DEAH box helicase domain-containing protein